MEPKIEYTEHIVPIGAPLLTTISVIAIIAIIVLLVIGLRSRIKGQDFAAVSWWLRSISLWVFVYGVFSFAAVPALSFAKIGGGGVGSSMVMFHTFQEAFSRLMLASATSLTGLTAILILGPQKQKENR